MTKSHQISDQAIEIEINKRGSDFRVCSAGADEDELDSFVAAKMERIPGRAARTDGRIGGGAAPGPCGGAGAAATWICIAAAWI